MKHAATRGAVLSLIGIVSVSVEYRSLITTMKRLQDIVLGSGTKVPIATNSDRPLAGKRWRCFCDFVLLPQNFAPDGKLRTVCNTSLVIKHK